VGADILRVDCRSVQAQKQSRRGNSIAFHDRLTARDQVIFVNNKLFATIFNTVFVIQVAGAGLALLFVGTPFGKTLATAVACWAALTLICAAALFLRSLRVRTASTSRSPSRSRDIFHSPR
jgi:hypothetical protein